MARMPRTDGLDSTLALRAEGYRFISNRCDALRTDVFETRLLLRRTLCMRGADAARAFYDPDRFRRRGAAPLRLQRTLFGRGGVQTLDGELHRVRKATFMTLLSPEGARGMARSFAERWRASLPEWEKKREVVLSREIESILCRTACEWAGVPLAASDARRRTRDLAALYESPAAVGPPHWRGRFARARLEGWIAELVRRVRNGTQTAPPGSALRSFAEHRDAGGRALSPRIAAVEILNVLRPTVAVSRFIVFSALALHEHPESRSFVDGGGERTGWFVQEVRRFYPFFPAVAARTRKPFTWNGYAFPGGARVLLDLYGTNRDPRLWADPEEFRPARFSGYRGDPFSFVPQGGGDAHAGHRCAGEAATVELMKAAANLLAHDMTYDVPPQDLGVSLTQMPAAPRSGFVMSNVKPAPATLGPELESPRA